MNTNSPRATRSALEGRMHLASTRSEVQLFFFFTSTFTSIQSQNSDFMAAVMSHPFIPFSCNRLCVLSFGVMGPRIYNVGAKHVGRNVEWCQRKAAGEFVWKGGIVGNNLVLLCADPRGYLEQVVHMCVHVCLSVF